MTDIEIAILQKRALSKAKMDAAAWEKIVAILLPCATELIPAPKGFFRWAC
jgi:hypothetical protein